MADRYSRVLADLFEHGRAKMTCRGNSMRPVLPNPCEVIYEPQESYRVGDIVLCRVNGRMIDAHFITKIRADGAYLISNNHNHDNGWTKTIYAKVVEGYDQRGELTYRAT